MSTKIKCKSLEFCLYKRKFMVSTEFQHTVNTKRVGSISHDSSIVSVCFSVYQIDTFIQNTFLFMEIPKTPFISINLQFFMLVLLSSAPFIIIIVVVVVVIFSSSLFRQPFFSLSCHHSEIINFFLVSLTQPSTCCCCFFSGTLIGHHFFFLLLLEQETTISSFYEFFSLCSLTFA